MDRFCVFYFIQVWFQNRRARHKRQDKNNSSKRLRRTPSYEEFSPASSTSSSRPSSTEPFSPDTCPWSTCAVAPSSSPVKIPTVPSPPASRCHEVCCSPPTICLSPPYTYFDFENLTTCNFEHVEENLWPTSELLY